MQYFTSHLAWLLSKMAFNSYSYSIQFNSIAIKVIGPKWKFVALTYMHYSHFIVAIVTSQSQSQIIYVRMAFVWYLLCRIIRRSMIYNVSFLYNFFFCCRMIWPKKNLTWKLLMGTATSLRRGSSTERGPLWTDLIEESHLELKPMGEVGYSTVCEWSGGLVDKSQNCRRWGSGFKILLLNPLYATLLVPHFFIEG